MIENIVIKFYVSIFESVCKQVPSVAAKVARPSSDGVVEHTVAPLSKNYNNQPKPKQYVN